MHLFAMWITLAGLTFLSVASAIDIKATIPNHLKECYNDSIITTKENLLPMTVSTLISIVRKLEDSFSKDMRVLTPAILHRYRFDGINRNPEIAWSDVVIPYSPEGLEFPLYQLIFQMFIPTTQTIPNNTLTYKERCTLHVMLSSSVDPWDRGDNNEPCSKINSQYTSSNWNWNENRYRRDTSKLSDAEIFDPKLGPGVAVEEEADVQPGDARSGDFQLYQSNFPVSQCPVENGVLYDKYGSFAPGLVLAGIATGLQQENVNIQSLLGLIGGYPRNNLRRNPVSGGRPSFDRPSRPRNQGVSFGSRFNKYGNTGNSDSDSGSNGRGNGRSYPSYGGGSYGGNTVDNRFAATLSGVLAEVALLLGPTTDTRMTSLTVGMNGGWNDTAIPKYYFLKQYTEYALTDARIRGALDGLILAKEIKELSDSTSGSLKLSQVLGMYYSDIGLFGTNVKACSRRDHNDEMNSDSQLKDYTTTFAGLLHNTMPASPTIEENGIQRYASNVVDETMQYISSSLTERCPSDSTSYTSSPAADLYIVIDANYDYKDISRVVDYLADRADISKYASNITLIGGFDGNNLTDTTQDINSMRQNFTFNSYYSIQKGFNFDKLLTALRLRFQDKMRYDQAISSGGGSPRVVVFIPSSAAKIDDNTSLRDKIDTFQTKLPDVKFIFLTTGAKDKFTPFADSAEDVFTISIFNDLSTALDPVIKRISAIPKRLIDPACGPFWSGGWYSPVTVIGYLNRPEVHYYRIHPNYFYKNADAQITFRNEDRSTTIRVCQSRKILQPSQNTTTTSTSTSNSNCISLTSGQEQIYYVKSSDCPNSYSTKCDPFYFSVNTDRSTIAQLQGSASCTDELCEYPNMVKYTIKHQGLNCYSSAETTVISSVLLIFVFCINLLR